MLMLLEPVWSSSEKYPDEGKPDSSVWDEVPDPAVEAIQGLDEEQRKGP